MNIHCIGLASFLLYYIWWKI